MFFNIFGCLLRASLTRSGWVGRWHLGHLLLCQTNRSTLPVYFSFYQHCPYQHHDAWLATRTGGIETTNETVSLSLRTGQDWLQSQMWLLTTTGNHQCPFFFFHFTLKVLIYLFLVPLRLGGCCLEDPISKTLSNGHKTLEI